MLAALGGTTMDGIYAGGRMLSQQRPSDAIDSPDHRYRAYIFLNDEHGNGSSVVVEHHWHGIHLGQFIALEYDGQLVDQIAVRWNTSNNLMIRCDQCPRTETQITNMTGANSTSATISASGLDSRRLRDLPHPGNAR
ncbi:hypothetical protein [Terriglobus aquaticus]|uniref:Uncharacterized protein n=1 Tax=Terriglobus aquaticus TaxID=940139 RepID=A0ABW9KMZ0_9BACT|nr:hypothetical protein [Terriglobus aquaticus]